MYSLGVDVIGKYLRHKSYVCPNFLKVISKMKRNARLFTNGVQHTQIWRGICALFDEDYRRVSLVDKRVLSRYCAD